MLTLEVSFFEQNNRMILLFMFSLLFRLSSPTEMLLDSIPEISLSPFEVSNNGIVEKVLSSKSNTLSSSSSIISLITYSSTMTLFYDPPDNHFEPTVLGVFVRQEVAVLYFHHFIIFCLKVQ